MQTSMLLRSHFSLRLESCVGNQGRMPELQPLQSPPWRHTRRGPPPAPRPPGSRHSELPAAGPGTCWDGVRERVCELTPLPLHPQAYTRCSGLARTRAPALQCLDVFLGAGEWPRRLVFSCVCAGMVPVAPAVGAVLVCACGPGGRRCGLMCVWYLR